MKRNSLLAAGLLAAAVALRAPEAAAASEGPVDTALVVAVDTSNSVDENRFRLQMEGIARALEDAGVQRAILNGRRGAVLLTLVEWSNRPSVAVPWTRIGSAAEARAFASRVRRAERTPGNFTCLGNMLRFVTDKVLPLAPFAADRAVVDVSGDGRDNCNPPKPVATLRDELVAVGATVNGLPILEGDEALTLEAWYEQNVIGGEGAFVLPALGFKDFDRAIRQKFITEIAGLTAPPRYARR